MTQEWNISYFMDLIDVLTSYIRYTALLLYVTLSIEDYNVAFFILLTTPGFFDVLGFIRYL